MILDAFNYLMLYEVGPHWDPNDPDVIVGACDTNEQAAKVGFVNDPVDPGGVTKYGISQRANPDIDIVGLTMQQAIDIYREKYFDRALCQYLQSPLEIIHFDGAVNHGVFRANMFLQQASALFSDGSLTLRNVDYINKQTKYDVVITNIAAIRISFYQRIVQNNPSQGRFLKGWTNRINHVTSYCLARLQ